MKHYDYAKYTAEDVKRALAHSERTPEDFQALLSPAALPFLEEIAQAAQMRQKAFWQQRLHVHTDLHCQLL